MLTRAYPQQSLPQIGGATNPLSATNWIDRRHKRMALNNAWTRFSATLSRPHYILSKLLKTATIAALNRDENIAKICKILVFAVGCLLAIDPAGRRQAPATGALYLLQHLDTMMDTPLCLSLSLPLSVCLSFSLFLTSTL